MFINTDSINNDAIILTNKRHKDAVDKTIASFENAIKDAQNDMPLDMVSINIQNGLKYLGEILGDSVSEDVINGIFAKFCLGK
jgi:tRNA modification GTPase